MHALEFQSTPPRGWRRLPRPSYRSPSPYFNPLHREGGDRNNARSTRCNDISIHSTARVETRQCFRRSPGLLISIHSTARVETFHAEHVLYIIDISIHSTARVETKDVAMGVMRLEISIHSTARVETRTFVIKSSIFVFQSTPPRGWRPFGAAPSRWTPPISIHSTARVETPTGYLEDDDNLFQSTPPRGWRRPPAAAKEEPVKISIHSTARVETDSRAGCANWQGISIHSTARVETLDQQGILCRSGNFNPLHREGGDELKRII